ncbi:MAG: Zn-ribbon domain-containing OB-fold protein [Myxococcota bacterium]
MSASDSGLIAQHVLEYDYRRSLGPVLGRFFTSLRARRLEGLKTRAGRVLVPPAEYDPETGESTTDEWVEVGPAGTVRSWAWVHSPRASHPLQSPFAFALVQLDGADTTLLHVVDAGGKENMETGMRVTPKWADETQGCMADIACFVPEDSQ